MTRPFAILSNKSKDHTPYCSGTRQRKIGTSGSRGPGAQLTAIYRADGITGCGACNGLARQMDDWGPDGCRKRIEQIVDEIIPRAKQWLKQQRAVLARWTPDVVQDAVLRATIRTDVLNAIAAAENALPIVPLNP